MGLVLVGHRAQVPVEAAQFKHLFLEVHVEIPAKHDVLADRAVEDVGLLLDVGHSAAGYYAAADLGGPP